MVFGLTEMMMVELVGVFLPAVVTWVRRHHQALAITVLTLISLGVGVGGPLGIIASTGKLLTPNDAAVVGFLVLIAGVVWLVALVWSCMAP